MTEDMVLEIAKNATIGDFVNLLMKFKEMGVTVKDAEVQDNGDFIVKTTSRDPLVDESIKKLQIVNKYNSLKSPNNLNGTIRLPMSQEELTVPWFPRQISELDVISNNVFMYGKDLDANHPSFKDETYRKRRIEFANIAYNYKFGDPIPRVEYTEKEKKTWGIVYRELLKLYKTHACRECQENLPLLQKYAGYCEDDLPQLETVSKFLKKQSGFTLRPVAGYISAREFLQGLAYRVFYCTQYIRHEAEPFYTVEPDCIHELMGHVPLLANPEFAQYSQELGLASLGVGEEDVLKLAKLYFFSAEFGICKQDGQLRAFGAGLLSSVSELKHALSDEAIRKPFIPEDVVEAECMVTTYQKAYFTTGTFKEAEDIVRHFVLGFERPFAIRYNPFTESVEVLDNLKKVGVALEDIKAQMTALDDAIYQIVSTFKTKYRIFTCLSLPSIQYRSQCTSMPTLTLQSKLNSFNGPKV
nr:tryptophan hydroxylase [Hymenolepis microstoma]